MKRRARLPAYPKKPGPKKARQPQGGGGPSSGRKRQSHGRMKNQTSFFEHHALLSTGRKAISNAIRHLF
jgi:hypothetical protein